MVLLKSYHRSEMLLFIVYRMSAVVFVQTSYVPDEYWQSLEVAHKMEFGYGYLTWEWKHGLRSYIYPFIFALLYKALNILQLDTPATVTIIPRLIQAFFTAVSDYYFLLLCKNIGCTSFWTKVFIFTNWFWYFCSSRTVLNMFETSLTIFAMYHYPWNIMKQNFSTNDKNSSAQWSSVRNKSLKYLGIVLLSCIVRPTAVVIWTPLILYQLIKLYPTRVFHFIFIVALPISTILLCTSLIVDYVYYQKLIFPPYNFFMTNVYHGIASFYGVHSTHWYVTQGIPIVLGLHTLPFLLGSFTLLKNYMKPVQDKFSKICYLLMIVVVINIAVFSFIPHKEFRFILPLLPMMEIIAIKFISDCNKFNSRKKYSLLLTTVLVVGFIVPVALFGIFHQRGTLKVMNYLSDIAHKQPHKTSLLFLTPCHSTPLYSHLHVNISVRFLTCDPSFSTNHSDESDDFFRKPITWLENNWNSLDYPSHVICFDSIKENIDNFLRKKGLVLKQSFMHTIFKGCSAGDNILVYER